MKRILVLVGVVVAAVSVALSTRSRVRAEDGCTLETLRGAYIYANTGFYVAPDGLGIWASAGRLVSDGAGSFTGTDTVSASGEVQRNRRYSGSYTITSECMGTLVFRDEKGLPANMDFVVTLDRQEAMFIQTDNNVILSGRARRQ